MAEAVAHQPLPPRTVPSVTDYALIGDGHSAALVNSQGAIDFWAPERFDAPTVFLRLLDPRAGTFETAPRRSHRVEAGYLPHSNVHRTRLVTSQGALAVTTFMPYAEAGHPRPHARRIMRLVECERGPVDMTVKFRPRFRYGAHDAVVEEAPGGVLARDGETEDTKPKPSDALLLRSTLPVRPTEGGADCTFRTRPGERHAFVLEQSPDTPRSSGSVLAEVEDALERENGFWREWLGETTYEGPYEEFVLRSLLALKLLQYVPDSSFVAAPTFGLPERPGGTENWDYRYTWLRDSAFIVMAFETTGHKEEAYRFRQWLARVVKRDAPDRLRPVYRVDGSPVDGEDTLPHLRGYADSLPVRVGNRASDQRQLDAYGDVMICFHRAPLLWQEEGEELWRALASLTEHALDHWQDEDPSIWEVQESRQYTYSKGMVWLALDHALTIAEKQGYDAPRDRWEHGKSVIREWLDAHGTGDDGAFVQSPTHRVADGALLLFPLFGITAPDDPVIARTIARVRQDLVSHDLAHRVLLAHKTGSEGAFLAVNFWLAHDLAHLGKVEEAKRALEAATGVASVLRLLPEEADPVTRMPLGNHPLGLSHYSLVLAAYAIREAERARGEQTSEASRSA